MIRPGATPVSCFVEGVQHHVDIYSPPLLLFVHPLGQPDVETDNHRQRNIIYVNNCCCCPPSSRARTTTTTTPITVGHVLHQHRICDIIRTAQAGQWMRTCQLKSSRAGPLLDEIKIHRIGFPKGIRKHSMVWSMSHWWRLMSLVRVVDALRVVCHVMASVYIVNQSIVQQCLKSDPSLQFPYRFYSVSPNWPLVWMGLGFNFPSKLYCDALASVYTHQQEIRNLNWIQELAKRNNCMCICINHLVGL